MKTPTARRIYAVLLALHPDEFQAAFAREMMCDFDDAREQEGLLWLFRDMLVSLLRQRLLRGSQTEHAGLPAPGSVPLSGTCASANAMENMLLKLALAALFSCALMSLPFIRARRAVSNCTISASTH